MPNIYAIEEERKNLNVSIKYKLGNTPYTYNWTDSQITLQDLYGVKVFDSSYLNGLLQTKNPDETLVYPLGLHLFGYIANILDTYTLKLNGQIASEKSKFPIIKTEDLSDPVKSKFNNQEDFNIAERKALTESFNFSDTENNSLTEKVKELRLLQQNNFQDTINLRTKQNKELSAFVNKLSSVIRDLKFYGEDLVKALTTFESAKRKNETARQRSEVLKCLPKSDTQEWKTFVQAGHDYSALLEQEKPQTCPYCHQELKSEEAISIINAYADFLSDTSEKELNDASEKLSDIRRKIEKLDVVITLTDEVKNVITESDELQKKIDQLSAYKILLQFVKKVEEIQMPTMIFSAELDILDNKKKEYITAIEKLNASKAEKDKKVEKLQKEIARLKEKKAIFSQKTDIEKYLSIHDTIKVIEKKKSETKTNQITFLANQAQKDLLTSTLKTNFEKELKALGQQKLKVELEVINGSKGKCNTQLKLTGNNSVLDILSEGEQKAVALAMFFAEIHNENSPIILDDPTTSLDHRIAAKLANRLLSLNNQIVVFTHYQLFMNSLSTTNKGHFCDKYGESTCEKKNKHIFAYEIDENLFKKGIINRYSQRNSKTIITKIEKEISTIDSSDLKDVPKNMRKCVEYLIDEVILKEQLLRKYCGGDNIKWDKLKKIAPTSSNIVDKLHEIHGRVSGGEIHVDMESEENPPTIQELQDFFNDLKAIQAGTYIQKLGKTQ